MSEFTDPMEATAAEKRPAVILNETALRKIANAVESRKSLFAFREKIIAVLPDYVGIFTGRQTWGTPVEIIMIDKIINEQARDLVLKHIDSAINDINEMMLSYGIEVRKDQT